ncbi:MAG: cyclase family protein [Solirubrobacterales bacterium]|nr:cyclase family protein [Solirubrobacterales bacterium]MBV9717136.1 cyclase family protein [Solirubrobacterales bacterium]
MSEPTGNPRPPAAGAQTISFTRIVDLSVGIIPGAVHEPWKPSVHYLTHEGEGLEWMQSMFGASPEDLVWSGGRGPAFEEVTAITHCGTHVDAPWHYGPESEGKPAKTIEQCPLEWFISDGVVLDVRHKGPNTRIEVEDLQRALEKIDYTLKPLDIVMIMSGSDARLGSLEYFEQPGMTRESTLWLLDQGIKVIGVDMYGFDRKFQDMADDFHRTGDGRVIWEAHFAGIEREYCQIEKLVNLDKLPPHGFKVACFPVKVEAASGGWCRAVAFL